MLEKIISLYKRWAGSDITNSNLKKIEQTKLDSEDKYICEVSFRLTNINDVELEVKHLNIDNSSTEQISELAEKCSNLIVLINSGLFKKKIIHTIKNYQLLNKDNEKNTLFLENILFFYKILEEETKQLKDHNKPLIRPLSVFRSNV